MASFTETLSLIIDAKTGGAVRDVQTFGKAVGSTGDDLVATATKGGFLDKQLKNLGLTGVSTGNLVAAGAAAGGAALVAFGRDAINTSLNYMSTTRDLQRVTGATAETSSRLVAVFDDLEISQEAAAKGFFKLSREIGSGRSQLDQFGVATTDSKGRTRDLEKILLDVADAYVNTEDKGRRAALVQTAFGRGGQELLPILEKGRAGIEKLFADVPEGQIFSQKQLDQARAYELALDNLNDAVDELKIAAAQGLIPVITEVANSLAETIRVANQATSAFGGIGGAFHFVWENFSPIDQSLDLLSAGVNLFSGNFSKAADSALASTGILGTGIKAAGKALGIFGGGSDDAAESGDRLADAQRRVADATAAAQQALNENGVGSKELTKAQRELRDAKHELASASDEVADALDVENDQQQENLNLAVQRLGGIASVLAAEQSYTSAIDKRTAAEMRIGQLESEGKQDTLEYAAAQRELAQAHVGVVQATVNVEGAVAKLAEQVKSGELSYSDYLVQVDELKRRNPEATRSIDQVTASVLALGIKIDNLPDYHDTDIRADSKKAEHEANVAKFSIGTIPGTHDTFIYADASGLYNTVADANRALYNLHQWSNVPVEIRAAIFGDIFGGVASRQHGGPIPGGVYDPYPVIAHGGEFVLSADVVQRIKAGRPSRGANANVGAGAMAIGGDGATYGNGGTAIVMPITVQGWVGNDQDLAEKFAAVLSRRGAPQMATRAVAQRR